MHRNHLAAGLLCGTLLALGLSATRPAAAYPGMGKSNAKAPARAASRIVYDCPRPGCNFESAKPGTCPQHRATLKKIAMAYTCPTDGMPVGGPGMCPRCAKEAAPHKIAVKGS
jgi:hypothetical protein